MPSKPKESESRTRSRSSSRSSRSATTGKRSRSRTRSRSRGRSKSPARKTKPSPSPGPKPKQEKKESSVQQKASTTPVRQSVRLREIAARQEEEEEQKTQNAPGSSKTGSKRQTKDKSGKEEKPKFRYEYGGPVGAFLMTLFLPAFLIFVNLACTKTSCTLSKLPDIPRRLDAYLDLRVALIYVGWLLLQAILAMLPLGRIVKGQPIKGGVRLNYRCNGVYSLFITLAVLAGLIYSGYCVNILYEKFLQFSCTAAIVSFLFSIGLYVRARNIPEDEVSDLGNSGSLTYDFFIGRELNPRVRQIDLKQLLLVQWCIMVVVMNSILVWKSYSEHSLNATLACVAAMQFIYGAEPLFFESGITTTYTTTDMGLGFLLRFALMAYQPSLMFLQTRFLLDQPQTWNPVALAAFWMLFAMGYIAFRGSNFEKHLFRTDPRNPMFANVTKIPSPSGRHLLASGWWGLCRHPNYLGNFIMILSWSLLSGSPAYDFFVGRELNPSVGRLDVKTFLVTCWANTYVVSLAALLWKAHTTNTLTTPFVSGAVMQLVLGLDAAYYGPTWMTTRWVTEEGVGFLFVFVMQAFQLSFNLIQAQFMLNQPYPWHMAVIGVFWLLFAVGYIIFRGSNSEKDRFRRDPHNPAFATFTKIPSPTGRHLLASGWWKLCRHPNYLGQWLLTWAWTLPCGCTSFVPYIFPITLSLLLMDRAANVDAVCRLKHGAAWDRYSRKVKYRLIPYVY